MSYTLQPSDIRDLKILTLLIIGATIIIFNSLAHIEIPVGKIGYTSTNEILEPGIHIISPLTTTTIKRDEYHVIDLPIPCHTTDGLQLLYHYKLYQYKWNPQYYLSTYTASESTYITQQVAKLTPLVTSYFKTIDEPNFELNIAKHATTLNEILTPHVSINGLLHDPKSPYTNDGYFQYLSNPQLDYTCIQSPDMCNAWDSLLGSSSRSPNEYNGVAPPTTRSAKSEAFMATDQNGNFINPLPVHTMMPLGNQPSTQAEEDAFDARIMKEMYG